jgi:hypothetical protein
MEDTHENLSDILPEQSDDMSPRKLLAQSQITMSDPNFRDIVKTTQSDCEFGLALGVVMIEFHFDEAIKIVAHFSKSFGSQYCCCMPRSKFIANKLFKSTIKMHSATRASSSRSAHADFEIGILV